MEKEQILILQSLVALDCGPNQRFTELDANMLAITPPMRFQLIWKGIIFSFMLQSSNWRRQIILDWCI